MTGEPTPDYLLEKYGGLLARALRPSLALRSDPSTSGRSSIGGFRMLARSGEAWPVEGDEPMLLLAQIDFSECPGLIEGLPSAGILQAFITRGDLPIMGETDLDKGAARLRLLPPGEGLSWIESDVRDLGYSVGFGRILTPPNGYLEGLTDEESDAVSNAFWADGHRMLGYPTSIQYDPLDYPEIYNPGGNRVLALQIDGDAALGWHWVDQGVLHFLADGESLALGRIQDALFDMQFR